MKFTRNYNIRWHDTNANREITPSAVLTFMQETTNKHIQTLYPTLEYIRDELHQAFILSKIYMRFYEPAYAYEDITVETWTGVESRGFTFYRSFRVKRGDTVIADALTTWALLDTIEHKLLPISKFENNFVDEPSLEVNMPRRIKFPDGEPELVGKRKIVYSDIDYNRHMNNTHYPNMLVDFLPSPEHYRVKELMLSFILGAMYNDELSVLRAQDGDNTFYFRTLNSEGKTCLEAYMLTEEQKSEIK
ncbi:MAG: acyl-[acyl-carrier-protein] thioesterase [Eubacteriales bacterium]